MFLAAALRRVPCSNLLLGVEVSIRVHVEMANSQGVRKCWVMLLGQIIMMSSASMTLPGINDHGWNHEFCQRLQHTTDIKYSLNSPSPFVFLFLFCGKDYQE